jgi:hypothetical protein
MRFVGPPDPIPHGERNNIYGCITDRNEREFLLALFSNCYPTLVAKVFRMVNAVSK